MQKKTDQTVTPPVQTQKPPLVYQGVLPVFKQLMEGGYKPYVWDVLNFGTKATVISGSIVAVQSPFKTILVNMTSGKSFIPTTPGIGMLSVLKSLYAGTGAAMTGSVMRTAYVTNVKGGTAKSEEHTREKQMQGTSQFPFLFWSAIGESLITGRSDSTSQLLKLKTLKSGKNGNMDMIRFRFNTLSLENNYKLIASGFGAKTAKSLVNFYALCILEMQIAARMKYGSEGTKHMLSGVFTGAAATLITFPLDFYKETMVSKMSVKNGKLVSPYSYEVLGHAAKQFFADPYGMARYFFGQAAKQVPVRAALTGGIFGIISTLSDKLGDKPAEDLVTFTQNKRVTFFSSNATEKPLAKVEPVAVQQQPSSVVTTTPVTSTPTKQTSDSVVPTVVQTPPQVTAPTKKQDGFFAVKGPEKPVGTPESSPGATSDTGFKA
jgi:hypothetical protein